MSETSRRLPHGSALALDGAGRLVAVRDPLGALVAELVWSEGALTAARVRLPDGRWLAIAPRAATHPLFGPADALAVIDDGLGAEPLGLVAALDYARIDRIPPLDRPAALPEGAGTAVLGLIAMLALAQGAPPLRYRGPYPTAALFDALMECWAAPPGLAVVAALAAFTAGVEEVAVAGEAREPPLAWRAHPFERAFYAGDGAPLVCVQLRRGVERVFVGGRGYAGTWAGARQLRPRAGGGWEALLVLAGEPWGDAVVLLDGAGVPEGPPRAPLPPPGELRGEPVPEPLRRALAATLVPRAPRLLAPALAEVLLALPMRFGDPGPAIARADGGAGAATADAGGLTVHAGLATRARSLLVDPAGFAALALALEPVASRVAQARLVAAIDAAGTTSSTF